MSIVSDLQNEQGRLSPCNSKISTENVKEIGKYKCPVLVNKTTKTFSVRINTENSLLDNNKYNKPCFNRVRSTDQNVEHTRNNTKECFIYQKSTDFRFEIQTINSMDHTDETHKVYL